MHVLLVNMPWAAVHYPSLAVGILRNAAGNHRVDDLYANLMWLARCMERDPELGVRAYLEVSEEAFAVGLGEWVFSRALNRTDPADYLDRARNVGVRVELAERYAALAEEFIDDVADQVVRGGYDLVGFTSTFAQNVPALALARRLKELRPDLITAFGGGNCDGRQGEALFRNFSFVDFVVRGEGEQVFPDLLDALESGRPDLLASLPGLCFRYAGEARINPQTAAPVPVATIPEPDFTSYFDYVRGSELAHFVEPWLVVESSRGCWWGEKHHCTFCGLNGATMRFRSHEPRHFVRMLENLVTRYQTLDVIMVDNILDMRYLDSVLPEIAAKGWDLRLHYEVKSNLRDDHVDVLARARVNHVQPGIESLSTRALDIMRKGVTGPQNVRLLRAAEERGLTVDWNHLYGFAGESDADYELVLAQIPALHHLQPPTGFNRIVLERFSPNFDDLTLGFPVRRPAWYYRYIYDLAESELNDLAYMFDAAPAGVGSAMAERMTAAITVWRDSYRDSSLVWRERGDGIEIEDRRVGWPPRTISLTPAEATLFGTLATPRSIESVERSAPAGLLDRWQELGLLFRDHNRFVRLPTSASRVPWKLRTARAEA
jgi:ribosomal peptide maturation radical SAM protein 1